MTTLDTFARSSAGAIHHSVSRVPLHPGTITGSAGALGFWAFGKYAFAGAVTGIALIGALLFLSTDSSDVTGNSTPPTSAVTPTTLESVVPEVNANVPTTIPDAPVPSPAPVVPPAAAADTSTTSVAPDTDAPLLVIDSPSQDDRFQTPVLRFSGRTEAGASVLASGKFTASVASDGSWFIDLVLAPGANGVVFTAADAAGNTSTAKVTVYLDEPAAVEPTTTTSTTAAVWEFTAVQKYGSCSLPIPYDVFSGQTKPGATVTVSSKYGNGSTTANAEGAWSVKVEFPTAPYNKTFVISATDYKGTTKTFEFVNLYSG